MAEGSKDPCISHIDASHGEWQRIESSLLFCNYFYIVKIIEKNLFSEGEIGFTRKKTSKTRNIFLWIFWHLRHFRAISLWKKQGPFHPWSFWWGLTYNIYLLDSVWQSGSLSLRNSLLIPGFFSLTGHFPQLTASWNFFLFMAGFYRKGVMLREETME